MVEMPRFTWDLRTSLPRLRGLRGPYLPPAASQSRRMKRLRLAQARERSGFDGSSFSRWDLQVLWQPCAWNSSTARPAPRRCRYDARQRVLAFAKSQDASHGLLLLTRNQEIGIYTPQVGLLAAAFRWQELSPDWHWLRAIGRNDTTAFFCDGKHVATVPAGVRQWPVRFGGDIDAKNPQGAGRLREIRFRAWNSETCDRP
ncbi:unnamed protein product [Effrenium voratum]|uniref:Uncharacterized protein n=1 Tax=Effrenium voratum TaxID=2562239 RepID=A0AA36JCK5_9DINO|nr:unnamed protein product [Effrenium voratum]CAJ1441196.1 unnamed protein product [Effrenium voratum]